MSFIQGVSGITNINNGSGNACTAAFSTQNTAAGSMLCAVVNVNGNTVTLNSVTDNQGGNTWVVLPALTPGTGYRTYFCYALGTTGGTKPTVTFNMSAATADVWYALGEYNGVNTYRGTSTAGAGSGTTPTPTGSVTSVINDLLIAYFASNQNQSTLGATSPLTMRETGGNGSIFLNGFADEIATGVSSSGSFTHTNGDVATAAMLAFYGSYSIGGSTGQSGTTVSYVGTNLGVSGSVTSTTGGAYSITGLPADTYTITPSQAGYTFSPTSASETITSANITGVNFTGNPVSSGYGIGTVKTSGASIAAKMCNGSGYGLPITSQTTSGKMNQPLDIVFCDKDGNELVVTGATVGVFHASPTPVVLCTPAGLPITPTITLTSNGNSVVVTATKTGKHFGKPVPVCLTDMNGFAYLMTGFSTFGAFIANPTPITLTDINGNIITLLIGA
ncbi:MAG: carboxypeptidase-like regulatory domain-containing protein [Candidatus Acidiferrales bacterium]